MIKEIKIYSRFNMEMFVRMEGLNFPYKNIPWHLISIHSGDLFISSAIEKKLKPLGCKDILSLEFWDVTNKEFSLIKEDHPNAVLFNKDHAKCVIDFIKKANDEAADSVLIIHCHAGISRSGAVGTFACDFLGLDYVKFIKENSHIYANSYILRILREEAGMTPVCKAHSGFTLPGEESVQKYKRLYRKRRKKWANMEKR